MKAIFEKAAIGLVSIVLLVGCNKEENYKLAFSHNLHVTDNGMACADCHGKMVDGRFAAPAHAACKDCHEDWIESKKIDAKTCGMCHKVKDLRELSLDKPGKLGSPVGGAFVHTLALSNRCADCHGILMEKKWNRVPEMTRKIKVERRDGAHRWGMACAACHVDMDPKTPPPSHLQNWTRRHGALGAEPDNVCGVCHREESCRECHQVTMPDSHNNLWRLKTHGVQAAWERQRCLVCHQQDSCDACHADTRPQSHKAGWDRSHCLNCHTSKGTGTGCALCHETDIRSHPNPHLAGWRDKHCNNCHPGTPEAEQCGVCHEGGASIGNHPNPHRGGWLQQHCQNCHAGPEATGCGLCHAGVTSVANHPDPHSAGWRSRHCFSCHEGTPAAEECAVCHPGGNSTQTHRDIWPTFHNHMRPGNCNLCHTP